MEISDCSDEFRELLVYLPLAILAEVFLCFTVLWNLIEIITCFILSILLVVYYLENWLYLSRNVWE